MLGVPSSWSSLTVADLVASSDNIDMRLNHMSSHFRTKGAMLGVPSSWSSRTVADLVATCDSIDMRLFVIEGVFPHDFRHV